jgi:hypothetical protein
MLITALFGAVGAWFIVDHVDEFAVVALEALPSALYRHTEISAEILSAPYAAVAQVLAHVYHLKRVAEGARAAAGGAAGLRGDVWHGPRYCRSSRRVNDETPTAQP